jgi:peptidoglycan/LPS O-acetylase OafA/YrhL
VAVTLVVLTHAQVPRLAGGYVGVDVFFVISGFLITSLLLREHAATGRVALGRFYARRALRLLPAACLVTAVTLAGAWLFGSKIRFTEYAGDAVSGVLYTMNLRLAAAGSDYLAEGEPPSPLRHLWSLAVEEQFYLLWPVLLLLLLAVARGRRRRVAAALAALCLASFWLSVTVPPGAPSWGYYGPHTRAWELGAGALLALAGHRAARLPAPVAAFAGWLGLGGVLLAAVAFDAGTPFPGHHALLPVLGTVLVLAAGGRGPGRLLAVRPAVWVGGLSYGWYLWHWPLLVIVPPALGRTTPGPGLLLPLAGVALLCAWAATRLVEDPLRFRPGLRRRPRAALLLGGSLSAGTAVLALTAAAFPPPIGSDAPAPVTREVLADAPDPGAALARLLADAPGQLPANLTPGLAGVKDVRSAVYRDRCHQGYEATVPRLCSYGDPDAADVVVLFGDSHAAQWFPALERLARDGGWRLVSVTKASCKVPSVTTVRGHTPYPACDTWRDAALEEIAGLRPDLVVTSSSEAATLAEPGDDPRGRWTDGFRETFGALTATGADVVHLLDTPWPDGDAVECAAVHPMRLARCADELPHAVANRPGRDDVRRAARDAAAGAGVTVVDPAPWLCAPSGDCPVVVGNLAVYRDDSHLAESYAEALAPVLARALPLPGGAGPG